MNYELYLFYNLFYKTWNTTKNKLNITFISTEQGTFVVLLKEQTGFYLKNYSTPSQYEFHSIADNLDVKYMENKPVMRHMSEAMWTVGVYSCC